MPRSQRKLGAGHTLLFILAGRTLACLLLHHREHWGHIHHFPVRRQAIGKSEVAGMDLISLSLIRMALIGRGGSWRLGQKRSGTQREEGWKLAGVHLAASLPQRANGQPFYLINNPQATEMTPPIEDTIPRYQ